MQVLDVRDRIYLATRAQNKCILRVQARTHDASLVLSSFEVRIWKAQEDFAKLCFKEKVGQKFLMNLALPFQRSAVSSNVAAKSFYRYLNNTYAKTTSASLDQL